MKKSCIFSPEIGAQAGELVLRMRRAALNNDGAVQTEICVWLGKQQIIHTDEIVPAREAVRQDFIRRISKRFSEADGVALENALLLFDAKARSELEAGKRTNQATVTPDASMMPPLVRITPIEPTKLADFAQVVNERLNRRADREEKQTISGAIGDWLERSGRLLLNDTGDALNPEPYLLDDRSAALPLVGKLLSVRAALAESGLNPAEAAFHWLIENLQARTINGGGRQVKLGRWMVRCGDTLYLSSGPTRIVRAHPGHALEVVRNGTDGVLFAADATLPEWEPVDPVDPMRIRGLRPVLEAPSEVREFAPDRQLRLLRAYLVALVANVRPIPALIAIGRHRGGKSTVARAITRLLLGPNDDVSDAPPDRRDFAAAVTSLPFFVIDNLDAEPEKWMGDALATAITGNTPTRRQMYTDASLFRRPATAAICITTRTAYFAKRPDILDRVLPLFIGEMQDGDRLSDRELNDEINATRDGVLSWLALTATRILAAFEQAPQGLPSRFVDFARIVWWLDPDDAAATLQAWEAAQLLAVADPDEFASAIITHFSDGSFRGSPSELVRVLQSCNATLPYLGGGKAIARRLRELRPLLSRLGFVLKESHDAGGHPIWHIYRRSGGFGPAERQSDETMPAEKPGENAESADSSATLSLQDNEGVIQKSAFSSDSGSSLRDEVAVVRNTPSDATSNGSPGPVGFVRRDEVLVLAERHRWRAVTLPNGKTVGPGETHWRRMLPTLTKAEQREMCDLLEAGEPVGCT